MSKKDEEILAEFYVLCGKILLGKADDEKETKRIVKAMIDSNQKDIMIEEFNKIGNTLLG